MMAVMGATITTTTTTNITTSMPIFYDSWMMIVQRIINNFLEKKLKKKQKNKIKYLQSNGVGAKYCVRIASMQRCRNDKAFLSFVGTMINILSDCVPSAGAKKPIKAACFSVDSVW